MFLQPKGVVVLAFFLPGVKFSMSDMEPAFPCGRWLCHVFSWNVQLSQKRFLFDVNNFERPNRRPFERKVVRSLSHVALAG